MGNFNFMQFVLIISVSLSLIGVIQSSEAGNWFSKSLDYFGLEKCSSLEKSGITGDFNTCLNSPVDSSSSSASSASASPPASSTGSPKYPSGNGQAKSGSGNTNSNWGEFGSSGFPQVRGKRGLGFGGSSTSGGSFGQSSFTGSSPSSSSSQSTSAESWPLSLIDDLQHMINCFPKLTKPCMVGSEVQFFNTIKNFFQAQVDYATPNASLIASVIASTGCVQGNSMDTSTVCYSTNIHKENWFGWKINWDDGQMCSFLGDVSKCETDSYSKCPLEVRSFVDGLWKAGFKVTPCLDGTDDTVTLMSTTLSSPLPVTDNPDDQSKSLASGASSFKVNQSPSRPTNITNINSNDKQSLEVTVNSFTVDNMDSDRKSNQKEQEEEGTILTKSMVPERSQRRSTFDRMDDEFNQEDRYDSNNENENSDYSDEGFEVNNDKKERVHSEFRRVDKADIERRHDRDQRERKIEDEQFSRSKEEFRKKMRDSLERRNSREYNEDEDDEEDKKFEIFEDRKDRFSSNRKNQEDERIRKYRKDQKDRKEREEEDRERQRNEAEAQRERQQEEEERQREYEERAREDERQRNERYERNQYKGERSSRPERYSTKAIPNNWYENKNDNQVNNDGAKGSNYESIRKCFESPFNSWSSKNHNSGDIMDLMCRKMESISSCLDNQQSTGQSNGQSVGHLMSIYGILCDPSRNFNDIDIYRVKQCLTY